MNRNIRLVIISVETDRFTLNRLGDRRPVLRTGHARSAGDERQQRRKYKKGRINCFQENVLLLRKRRPPLRERDAGARPVDVLLHDLWCVLYDQRERSPRAKTTTRDRRGRRINCWV